jgi:hypothetical protein
MAYVSTVIALSSLVVSVVALFFSQLRSPKISSVIGPNFKVYYPVDGGFGVYLPVTFLNESPRTGTVHRCGISIFRKSSLDEKFFMEWRYFMVLNPSTNSSFKFDEGAHALAIPGKSSTAKLVWLTWRSDSTPELVIAEGDYVLIFHYWLGLDDKPQNALHEFYIDRSTHALLDKYRATKDSIVVDLLLDKKIAANKLLTSYLMSGEFV